MKVRITAAGLPVPIGTIMEVGEKAPAAWAGKYEPVIIAPTVKEVLAVEDGEKPRIFRKRNG